MFLYLILIFVWFYSPIKTISKLQAKFKALFCTHLSNQRNYRSYFCQQIVSRRIHFFPKTVVLNPVDTLKLLGRVHF